MWFSLVSRITTCSTWLVRVPREKNVAFLHSSSIWFILKGNGICSPPAKLPRTLNSESYSVIMYNMHFTVFFCSFRVCGCCKVAGFVKFCWMVVFILNLRFTDALFHELSCIKILAGKYFLQELCNMCDILNPAPYCLQEKLKISVKFFNVFVNDVISTSSYMDGTFTNFLSLQYKNS